MAGLCLVVDLAQGKSVLIKVGYKCVTALFFFTSLHVELYNHGQQVTLVLSKRMREEEPTLGFVCSGILCEI